MRVMQILIGNNIHAPTAAPAHRTRTLPSISHRTPWASYAIGNRAIETPLVHDGIK